MTSQPRRGRKPKISSKETYIDQEDSFDELNDTTPESDPDMRLKPNHHELPYWVCSNLYIIVDVSNPLADEVSDFINRIAEVKSRMDQIHEYCISDTTLNKAMSFGMNSEMICEILDKYSKNYLTSNVRDQITKIGRKEKSYKLVLSQGKYYLQCEKSEQCSKVTKRPDEYFSGKWKRIEESNALYKDLDLQNEVFLIEVTQTKVFELKKQCKDKNLRIYEEYHFLKDKHDELPITLKNEQLRPHQEKALQQVFENEIARSGVIVLPCGAGKTYTAIAACSKIKRSTIVLAHTTRSVFQWRDEFIRWSTIDEGSIFTCVAGTKKNVPDRPLVFITTYSMIAFHGERAESSKRIISDMLKREWGLMIFDEVHGASTENIKRFVANIKAQCKIGLTATFVREDDKIGDLEFMIGPKLYEAPWQNLVKEGYIANAKCFEILIPMTELFYKEYINENTDGVTNFILRKRLLEIINPNKFQICRTLINKHSANGHKIIVFCDTVSAAVYYADRLKIPKQYMSGSASDEQRKIILDQFKSGQIDLLITTKVGDVGLDLPDANVAIQLSSSSGSRRQEAQRLGRVLRPKEGYNYAYFYSLTSKDTREMDFSQKRQSIMKQNGYEVRVLHYNKIQEKLKVYNQADELELIKKIKDGKIASK